MNCGRCVNNTIITIITMVELCYCNVDESTLTTKCNLKLILNMISLLMIICLIGFIITIYVTSSTSTYFNEGTIIGYGYNNTIPRGALKYCDSTKCTISNTILSTSFEYPVYYIEYSPDNLYPKKILLIDNFLLFNLLLSFTILIAVLQLIYKFILFDVHLYVVVVYRIYFFGCLI